MIALVKQSMEMMSINSKRWNKEQDFLLMENMKWNLFQERTQAQVKINHQNMPYPDVKE